MRHGESVALRAVAPYGRYRREGASNRQLHSLRSLASGYDSLVMQAEMLPSAYMCGVGVSHSHGGSRALPACDGETPPPHRHAFLIFAQVLWAKCVLFQSDSISAWCCGWIRLGQFNESRFNQRSHDAFMKLSKITVLYGCCNFS